MESGASNPPERHRVHYYLIIIAIVSILFTFFMACIAIRTYNKEEEKNQHPLQSPNTPNQLESGSVRRNQSIADPPPVYTREPLQEQPSVLTCPEMAQVPPPPPSVGPESTIVPANVVAQQHRLPSYDEECLDVQKQCFAYPPPSA
ncbi:hypothetical protein F5887DRAFT_1286092 [Amanita rubescens]|nr:hypothetical protein F5887DRAFT_1286092 [Amanita rubescens]